MQKLSILILFSLASAAICSGANAKGNVSAGKAASEVCQACHGTDGKSIDPSYPNLAGQHASYLVKTLQDYRSGARNDAVMTNFSANLTDQQIEDLAAFYASQKGLVDLSGK